MYIFQLWNWKLYSFRGVACFRIEQIIPRSPKRLNICITRDSFRKWNFYRLKMFPLVEKIYDNHSWYNDFESFIQFHYLSKRVACKFPTAGPNLCFAWVMDITVYDRDLYTKNTQPSCVSVHFIVLMMIWQQEMYLSKPVSLNKCTDLFKVRHRFSLSYIWMATCLAHWCEWQ